MTDLRPPWRPPFFWLPVAGALIGLVILGMRIATLPEGGARPFLLGLAAALAVTVLIVAGFALAVRARMRVAAAAFPAAVLIPIVVGAATAAATRWLAANLGDSASLRLSNSSYATLAIDAAGVHVVRTAAGPHGLLRAASVGVGPLGRTIVGMREVDALVLEIDAGAATAPLPVVPMRLRGNPLRALTDAELFDLVGRIDSALHGRPTAPGWDY